MTMEQTRVTTELVDSMMILGLKRSLAISKKKWWVRMNERRTERGISKEIWILRTEQWEGTVHIKEEERAHFV